MTKEKEFEKEIRELIKDTQVREIIRAELNRKGQLALVGWILLLREETRKQEHQKCLKDELKWLNNFGISIFDDDKVIRENILKIYKRREELKKEINKK